MIFTVVLILTTLATGDVNKIEFSSYDDCRKAQYVIGLASADTHTAKCKMLGVSDGE